MCLCVLCLCGPSKGTLWCYTSICDCIMLKDYVCTSMYIKILLIYTRLLNPQIYFRSSKLILPFFVFVSQAQNNLGYKAWSSASRFFENRCETLVDRSRPLCQVRNSAQNRKMRNQIIKVAAAGELKPNITPTQKRKQIVFQSGVKYIPRSQETLSFV